MSQWTHVSGNIRIDSLFGIDDLTLEILEEILGKVIDFEDEGEWETKLPLGSEGSIKYVIWENPRESALAHYSVSIFGDLRNYDDVNEIEKWFEGVLFSKYNIISRKTKKPFEAHLIIRDAVLSIDVEYQDKVVLVYRHIEKKLGEYEEKVEKIILKREELK